MMESAGRTGDAHLRSGRVRVLLVFTILLVARGLGVYSEYFWEQDEVSLALGVAALMADAVGSLYRYTVQLGYYRLVELLDLLSGGRIDWIPAIMKGLSAIAGALVPVAAFFAFRRELPVRERRLVLLSLAINPIVWKSSQYGNTAIVATALATTSLVVLSNRPARTGKAVALILLGLATLVRADTVLLAPVLFLLLRRSEGSFGRALKWSTAFGLAMLLLYAAILAIDPRIDGIRESITQHMGNASPTMFWEFLMWAMSPIPLIFAVWALRSLLDSRPWLLTLILAWCLPTLLFYFRATTTPRYMLNAVVPLSIAAAVGMAELAGRLRPRLGARLAWTIIVGAAGIHLFLALGHFSPDWPSQPLRGATFRTHDGPMPTGALLYSTYLDPGSLARSLPRPHFGRSRHRSWEGPVFTKAANILADHDAPRRTVLVVLAGDFRHALHWHLQIAGARYISRPLRSRNPWDTETWLRLRNSRVMTVARDADDYRAPARFDLTVGDRVWVLGDEPFPDSVALSRMPPGMELLATDGFDSRIRTFHVAVRSPRVQ